ncbi:MAG: general secretion pathway protein GspD [Planctomycetota bacterium]|nr:general secretion pathway protein GspD [Planctomycetota bacterium]
MNETIRLRKLRFLSAMAAAAGGLFGASVFTPGAPLGATATYAQLMAPPSGTSPSPNTTSVPTQSGLVAPPMNASTPATPTLTATAAVTPPANPLRDQAVALSAQAKLFLSRGDLANAQQFVERANALRVPDSAYTTGQLRPWQVAMEIERAQRSRSSGLVSTGAPAAGVTTAAATQTMAQGNINSGVFQPANDATQITQAGATSPSDTPQAGSTGEQLYRKGMDELVKGNRQTAIDTFTDAWKYEAEMDSMTRAQLKDKLMLLQGNVAQTGKPAAGASNAGQMQEVNQEQAMARQKMWREVTTEIAEAEKMVSNDPSGALDRLQALRQRTSQSNADGSIRKSHLAMIDRVITNIQAYVDQNRPAIDQQERNRRIEDTMALEAATRARIDGEIQSMVDQYNDLMETANYTEAEIIAKKVGQLDPKSQIATVMHSNARLARRIHEQNTIADMKSTKGADAFTSVDQSSIPIDDRIPMSFGDAHDWDTLTRSRRKLGDVSMRMTPAEKMIREKMIEPIDVTFDNRPLSQAMETINQMTGIPIFIDPIGISAEGITSGQPVTLQLGGTPISLKSALNLMLDPYGLTYTIKNEVLNITSKQTMNREQIQRVYSVKDLVIPIPNFVSNYNSGLAGALQSAYQAHSSTLLVRTNDVSGSQLRDQQLATNSNVSLNPDLSTLGQFNGGVPGMGNNPMGGGGFGNMMGGGRGPVSGSGTPFINGNPNGMGGAQSLADPTELINLIRSTVPGNWDSEEDKIEYFTSNISLIISAPLETQEQVADLLKQLRLLQNLQVTIEVRFITLADNFFEKMGIDFDFNIRDKKLNGAGLPRADEGSASIGLSAATGTVPVPTTNLDVQFRQASFGVTPQFGGGTVTDGAQLGFAILSDLELFFFLQAAQGDTRTNVMQAPKVTMFDGQLASITDQAQRPFVIGLTPVVGDFAVAQQPIVVILNDGTSLNVQSVVSQDKRFVRMTLSPSFTRIEDADRTFTFTGTTSSRTGTSVIGPDGKPTTNRNNEETVVSGSTVQLPTLGVTNVSTTVNVPDGGTILLGGIKRLREGRTERGVPMLSKIPYINRLFKNVAIGRDTNTLMMTVTPRIIIPEEEEEKYLGSSLP